jgi:hypothetical protein
LGKGISNLVGHGDMMTMAQDGPQYANNYDAEKCCEMEKFKFYTCHGLNF